MSNIKKFFCKDCQLAWIGRSASRSKCLMCTKMCDPVTDDFLKRTETKKEEEAVQKSINTTKDNYSIVSTRSPANLQKAVCGNCYAKNLITHVDANYSNCPNCHEQLIWTGENEQK